MRSSSCLSARFAALVVLLGVAAACASSPARHIRLASFKTRVPIAFESDQLLAKRVLPVPVWHDARVDRIVEMFEQAGCKGEHLHLQNVNGSRDPNVVCTLPGSSGRRIVVAAHHTRAGEGKGIADDWTGAALLPALYASLASSPRHHRYEFIAFTMAPTFGDASYLYLRDDAALRDSIAAMVWLDFMGVGEIKAWGTRTDPNLWEDLSAAGNAIGVEVGSANLLGVSGIHDHSRAFRWFDIPTAYVHTLDRESQRVISESGRLDLDPSRLDLPAYRRAYRVLAVYLGYIDKTLAVRRM